MREELWVLAVAGFVVTIVAELQAKLDCVFDVLAGECHSLGAVALV